MSKWQPIETAPKDGRGFLIYSSEAGIIAWYDEDFIKPWPLHIAHWMPLPEPPQETSEAGMAA